MGVGAEISDGYLKTRAKKTKATVSPWLDTITGE